MNYLYPTLPSEKFYLDPSRSIPNTTDILKLIFYNFETGISLDKELKS